MIEINLIQRKKKRQTTVVAGIDLSKLNLKMLVVAFVLYFAQDSYLPDYFSGLQNEVDTQIQTLNAEKSKIRRELKKHENIKEKLKLYERRRRELKRRSSYVDQILKTRTNPRKVLERLARSVPDDMWFESIMINPQKEILIKGKAEAYKSIGDFLTMANESAFFGKSLTLSDAGTKSEDEVLYGKKKRIEVFEVKGKIETFDPFQQK